MWQFLLQNCRIKFIPADVMFCGNFTRQLLTGMEGSRENVSKVVIKSDCSPEDTGGWERKGRDSLQLPRGLWEASLATRRKCHINQL